ncbi:MAG: cation:proton antiporter [Eubacteriales bacterium]|nr:cation:proton antiporter [Eubacteriales bacterium]
MLISVAYILICGFALSGIFQKLKLPGLLGMVIAGIILGPQVLNVIDGNILAVSHDLREIALIVIMIRAGLSMDLADLKKVGRPAILLSFIPATFEIIGVLVLAPALLGISYIEAAILGAILAAVSPAVIVPKMITLIEKGYGRKKCIPQLVMAGAAVDDIYAIVLFTSFIGLYKGYNFNGSSLVKIPFALFTGALLGFIAGALLVYIFKKLHIRDTIKVLLIIGICFLFVGYEDHITRYIPFSGLLAVIALSITILELREIVAKRISVKFSKIWVAAELILFVLIGTAVDIQNLYTAGLSAAVVILGALLFRAAGVMISLSKAGLNFREALFCNIGYLPKATVQAAVGAIPLAAGVTSGNVILSVAVLSIFLTAPLGALAIDLTYKKLLEKD